MATKTLAEKLLIKPNSAFWLSDAEHLELSEPPPDGVRLVSGPGHAAVALVFAADAASLRQVLDASQGHLANPGIVWIADPKVNRTDIDHDKLWPIAGGYGLRLNERAAVDGVWSALRFRAFGEGKARFTSGGRESCPTYGRAYDEIPC